jgi:hypothetical protein
VILVKQYSDNQIERDEVNGVCVERVEVKKRAQVSFGTPEGKRSLGGTRYRWENNILMLKRTGCHGLY